MDLLARREHSLKELRDKLAARDYAPDDIEAALEGLARDGLASDDRFVEAFVASRIRRGQGPIRIRAELAERGVDGKTIARCLAGDHDWRGLARQARAKRFGAERPVDFRERARQARFLEQRGFTSDHVRWALSDDE